MNEALTLAAFRQWAAIYAMQGLLAAKFPFDANETALEAVAQADALLAAFTVDDDDEAEIPEVTR